MDRFAELRAAIKTAELVDAHAHNIVAVDSSFPFLNCFSEAAGDALSYAPHTINFKVSVESEVNFSVSYLFPLEDALTNIIKNVFQLVQNCVQVRSGNQSHSRSQTKSIHRQSNIILHVHQINFSPNIGSVMDFPQQNAETPFEFGFLLKRTAFYYWETPWISHWFHHPNRAVHSVVRDILQIALLADQPSNSGKP